MLLMDIMTIDVLLWLFIALAVTISGVFLFRLFRFGGWKISDSCHIDPYPQLTSSENKILAFLCAGKSTHEISDILQVSVGTVRSHLRSIFKKLEVHSQSQLVAMTLRELLSGDRDKGAVGVVNEELYHCYPLTPSEKKIVFYLCQGRSLCETAERLQISVNSARSHLKNIFKKLDVHSQLQLVVKVLTDKFEAQKPKKL